MKCIKTALSVAAVVGLIAGYVARDTQEYLRSPFSGNKHEITYSSRSPNFTSTTRIRLDKQPDIKTKTFLDALHEAQSDLLAFMSDKKIDDFQRLKISTTFDVYQRLIIGDLSETNTPEDQKREKPIQRQERLPNDSFKAYPVFARR